MSDANSTRMENGDTYWSKEWFAAVDKNDVRTLRKLSGRSCFNVDVKNEKGWTALMKACYNDFPDLVAFLLSKYANIEFDGDLRNMLNEYEELKNIWNICKSRCILKNEIVSIMKQNNFSDSANEKDMTVFNR